MSAALAEVEVMPVPTDLTQETSSVIVWANGLKITNNEEYSSAVEYLKGIKSLAKRAADFFKPLKQKADEAKRVILDAEKQIVNPLTQAESIAKNKMLAFTQEQERGRRAEESRLQAEANETARKERERLEREAAKLKTPEKREERMEAAQAVVAPVVHVAPTVQPVAGASIRKLWKYRVTDINAVPRDWMQINDKALASFATSTKGQVAVAGIEFYSEDSMAIGGRS